MNDAWWVQVWMERCPSEKLKLMLHIEPCEKLASEEGLG